MSKNHFISLLCLVLACSGYGQEKQSKFMRLAKADEPLFINYYYSELQDFQLKWLSISCSKLGNRLKTDSEIHCANDTLSEQLLNAFSAFSSNIYVDNPVRELDLVFEVGCPEPKRKRYPCTVREQLTGHLDSLASSSKSRVLIPILYIGTRSYNAPAEGGAMFTIADSGYNWNYIWYTLAVYIFEGSELIYYDQHTYFVNETLPDGVFPEFSMPQSAVDSLVTLTMKGYVDRLK